MFVKKCPSMGLIGKLHMTLEMSDKDVASEIQSGFKSPMNNNNNFHFQHLQAAVNPNCTSTKPFF